MISYKTHRVPFERIPQLARIDVDYATDPGRFSQLITGVPGLEGLRTALGNRRDYPTDRETLYSVVRDQYERLKLDSTHVEVLRNSDTYTLTTAHQPALLTGPLYFIYKICSTINLARRANDALDDCTIIPVFVLGGEDHDFEEMNHLQLFNKTFQWQSDQTGSVGRMGIGDLKPVLESISETLGTSPHSDELRSLISESFVDGRSYGDCMQHFVTSLFADTGLIVLQLDDPGLKGLFKDVILDELNNQTSSSLINPVQSSVETLGYKPQAYVRDINLFYLDKGMRNRIELNSKDFKIVDTSLTFTPEDLQKIVEAHPERFSPNVNLRPLYQETVLPNLAYIGGGGEIAYWLERKKQFEHYGVPFPILIRRNSVLHINKSMHKLREKLDIPLDDVFEDPEKEISAWVRDHAEHEVEIESEMNQIDQAVSSIVEKANAIDPTFARSVEAFKVKLLKDVDQLGKRLVREEKSLQETQVNQIRKLFDRLHPSGNLQERYDNFIPFYLASGHEYLEMLIKELDPLKNGFIVIEEE